jgi:hypothetical protein
VCVVQKIVLCVSKVGRWMVRVCVVCKRVKFVSVVGRWKKMCVCCIREFIVCQFWVVGR